MPFFLNFCFNNVATLCGEAVRTLGDFLWWEFWGIFSRGVLVGDAQYCEGSGQLELIRQVVFI